MVFNGGLTIWKKSHTTQRTQSCSTFQCWHSILWWKSLGQCSISTIRAQLCPLRCSGTALMARGRSRLSCDALPNPVLDPPIWKRYCFPEVSENQCSSIRNVLRCWAAKTYRSFFISAQSALCKHPLRDIRQVVHERPSGPLRPPHPVLLSSHNISKWIKVPLI